MITRRAFSILFAAILISILSACGSSGAGSSSPSVVPPPSSAKAITAFSFASPAATGIINESAKTISVTVPYGTIVTALIATFTTTGASVRVGSTVQTSGSTPNNFTNSVNYTVTAANSTTATYTVTVTIAPNTAKAITAFSFTTPAAIGTINESAKTIAVTVPSGTTVTALIATFTTTGANVRVGSTVQTSGSTPNNFTNPVDYIVTAADASTATYRVTVTVAAPPTGALIIDHNAARNFDNIPAQWVTQAKSMFLLAYGHTSHGSQIPTGMAALSTADTLYSYTTGANGFLCDGCMSGASDLGNPDRTSWATATRNYLNGTGSNRNVIMWSWCGQVDGTEADINTYLSLMTQLEQDFPNVTFIYMTGHLNGTGLNGNVNQRNEQIRSYCTANNKILFDFADIESFDPTGPTNFMLLNATDTCNYTGGNWAQQWITANPNSALTQVAASCGSCAHSERLNCVLKARAFWYMMARLAGWDGN